MSPTVQILVHIMSLGLPLETTRFGLGKDHTWVKTNCIQSHNFCIISSNSTDDSEWAVVAVLEYSNPFLTPSPSSLMF